jgi:hypothetical protein
MWFSKGTTGRLLSRVSTGRVYESGLRLHTCFREFAGVNPPVVGRVDMVEANSQLKIKHV